MMCHTMLLKLSGYVDVLLTDIGTYWSFNLSQEHSQWLLRNSPHSPTTHSFPNFLIKRQISELHQCCGIQEAPAYRRISRRPFYNGWLNGCLTL